jgi:hypothetical protein
MQISALETISLRVLGGNGKTAQSRHINKFVILYKIYCIPTLHISVYEDGRGPMLSAALFIAAAAVLK